MPRRPFSPPPAVVALGLALACATSDELVAIDRGAAPGTFTLLGDRRPSSRRDTDMTPVEVGVKFRSAVSGEVTAIRFYRSVEDPAGYMVNLWDAQGRRLASTVHPGNEPHRVGWRTARLPAPVPIEAGTVYVASYYTEHSQYEDDQHALATPIQNGPLTAPADADVGGNGVYVYGRGGGFPNLVWRASNYWVDVQFKTRP